MSCKHYRVYKGKRFFCSKLGFHSDHFAIVKNDTIEGISVRWNS